MSTSPTNIICLCHCIYDHANALGDAIGSQNGRHHVRLEGFAEAYALSLPEEQKIVASELARHGWDARLARTSSPAYQDSVDRAWIHSLRIHDGQWPLQVAQTMFDPHAQLPIALPKPVTNLSGYQPAQGVVISDQLRLDEYPRRLRSYGATVVHQQDSGCSQTAGHDLNIRLTPVKTARNYRIATQEILRAHTTELHTN
ncbi:hypothetical protein [Glutamicibacter ardleyensis]|uniref:hypothetical protein n=1 Tax=Glutamicibacter ardleyensis TaxID=225894 RepID=UPI003FD5140D